jgi:hypothetical protein
MTVAIVLVAAGGRCGQRDEQGQRGGGPIREPAVAGAFYPDEAQLLTQQVDHFLDNVPPQDVSGRLLGLVVPHAGYVFSGQIAAYSYDLIRDRKIGTIIMVGCSHRTTYSGASIYRRGSYRTPLGLVPIDEALSEELISRIPSLRYVPEAHLGEHSLEVQLPFLQKVLGEFRLVPILLGHRMSPEELESLAEVIAESSADREGVLLVASTDLSHYPSYQDACQVDRETLDLMAAYQPDRLIEYERNCRQRGILGLQCAMCGTEAVMVVMMAARMLGADSAHILKYANSGDVPMGDHDRVVGYGAVAFCEEEPGDVEQVGRRIGDDGGLNEEERRQLLTVARQSISAGLEGRVYTPPEPSTERLGEHRGAFVTLHKQGQLRGCIGQFQPDMELVRTVAQMAQAAAFRDGRFPPLSEEELEQIEIEISVLSPLHEISTIDEIEPGTHGIWITRGARSGCYLPQVATQMGWSGKEFVEHCCLHKAHLSADAYLQEGTRMFVFTAQVFEEGD